MRIGKNLEVPIQDSDLEGAISNAELLDVFVQLVNEVRSSDSQQYQALKQGIMRLEQMDAKTQKNRTPAELFTIYEELKATSIQIRKLLNNFMTGVAQYDTINYAFYYKGKRYVTDEIKQEWLVASQSSGLLRVNLDKAVKDLEANVTDSYRSEISEIFNKHYATYEAAITGTYKGKGGIGHTGALNYGHIAEAYEQHIMEDHPKAYDIVNFLNSSSEQLTTLEKAYIGFASETDSISYWTNHEGMYRAWQHIREAMGIQKGTVAGDVLSRQVKSARKKEASLVRLANFNTLKTGVETYCEIVNNDIPAIEVAQKLVKYMGEPVRKISAKVIDGISIEDDLSEWKTFNETIEQLRKQNISLWKT